MNKKVKKTLSIIIIFLFVFLVPIFSKGCIKHENPIKFNEGVVTIYDKEVDPEDYYLVKEGILWNVDFYNGDIIFAPVMELTKKQVEELEKYSVGQYVDYTVIDKKIEKNNEFIYMKDDKLIKINTIEKDKEKIVKDIPSNQKEDVMESLSGYVIDLEKLKK